MSRLKIIFENNTTQRHREHRDPNTPHFNIAFKNKTHLQKKLIEPLLLLYGRK